MNELQSRERRGTLRAGIAKAPGSLSLLLSVPLFASRQSYYSRPRGRA